MTIVEDKETGETDMVSTLAENVPTLLLLVKGLQDQKFQSAEREAELLRKNNNELARQTRLIKQYNEEKRRLAELGIELPETPPPEDDAGLDVEEPVVSDRPFSPTSLGEEIPPSE